MDQQTGVNPIDSSNENSVYTNRMTSFHFLFG